MKKDILLTEEGKAKLEAELKHLIEEKRVEITENLREARAYGDLSENAEYDAVREEQSRVEGRIEELTAILKHATVIQSDGDKSKVDIGDTITVEVEGDTETYMLVSTAESDPKAGHISVESPLGRALLGAKVGEKVEVTIPDGGTVTYAVKKIS